MGGTLVTITAVRVSHGVQLLLMLDARPRQRAHDLLLLDGLHGEHGVREGAGVLQWLRGQMLHTLLLLRRWLRGGTQQLQARRVVLRLLLSNLRAQRARCVAVGVGVVGAGLVREGVGCGNGHRVV
eukprot:CAMPEP_0202355370 /NCGR_PEP_ID=MMETSP1126-20121109/10295_1 /ASSEMBLY_ACC=CAM_ASM_000457 /TAXON_ID=3047 /ORGANISM="Dunaliella tertiolecta, Strain CCMP1320" /LENGTH=125 /DNA_ID=CAMNT_0048947979 /DNA_START=326 /DNA_END=703 /DNA_ORIENTATION=+